VKIAISGGSGFIGTHLLKYLADQRNEIIIISRSQQSVIKGARRVTWEQLEMDNEPLENLDAWINLAGETINQRWTHAAKERIMSSRVDVVEQMIKLIHKLQTKPKVVINGSAVGIYGTSETETFTEQSDTSAKDFLSMVVVRWEQAIDALQGIRIVKLRTGLVLGMDGGALPRMMQPYRLSVGGRVGKGSQWISWIHIEDLVRLIDFCIQNNQISGAVNAAAPYPVTMDQFGRTIATVLRRPHLVPVPGFALKLLFGEMAILVLEGQRVLPQVLLDQDFTFHYSRLEKALRQLTETKKTI
jgi:uncharacterized protein (TIGR01777 family)